MAFFPFTDRRWTRKPNEKRDAYKDKPYDHDENKTSPITHFSPPFYERSILLRKENSLLRRERV
ncbi:MAG: hypothetical protein A3J30_03845 [Candidatus Wildermuthbacteria bacterium RIFCSPLOWO2_02_FULL_47_9c]|uniref:Uncharacterized protein n=1 Tax=Candidatus Wildermuthbacteria bacterium RIFCSPLOWO2_02_FULL_47_9c TaxID=1802466 RepID=A0A1G2RUE9_9BACT|nr:MAG: hypothetical protein A2109_01645 [Candidatus Wildermuthbacteria bacterium GWA1_49_26]OHA65688.1 MAG: hypothetical protein A2674_03720 [Candidatus Wildermuthbacteria bacterium RIFCSPHIGHO2_01_FULL_50_47]OHA69386.1 MAG: hypothetical protein A3D63_00225 [Candidatus Wildermuthbacteria bacterium RIFCSPHIGHO2_02_FULL_49_17]OHA74607.1 MAG: hypothetical protein A3B28_03830 [Candidatus Wildermuthbacteria bacterium RIFCSPLOWO2_01_FULL_50_46]OHA76058.1 MAG: hypothetical protein A3J30_03845 [Candid